MNGISDDPTVRRDSNTDRDVAGNVFAELARREGYLRTTLENVSVGFMMIDADGRVQVTNERALKLLDLPAEFMAARPTFAEVRAYQVSQGEFSQTNDEFRTWVAERGIEEAEHRYERERPDGSILEVRTTPIPGGGAVRTYTDVTETRRAEASLREATTILNATLDNMDQGLLMVDGDGVVQVYNDQAIRMLGLSSELMRRRPQFAEVVAHQIAADEFGETPSNPSWMGVGCGPHDAPHAYERTRPNGSVLEIRTVKLSDGGAVRTFTDLTARKRHEAALAESEARYRALADSLPQMVWVVRASDGEASYVNRQFSEYYGDIGTARVARVARNHPDDAARVAAEWIDARGVEGTFETNVRLRRRDGAYRWHRLVMNPVRRDGELVEWIGTALDIDDIVRDREALQETSTLIRLAQDGAGAGLFNWDLQAGEAVLSVESLRIFGLPENRGTTITAADWKRIVHPDDLPTVMAESARSTTTGTPYRIEFRVRHADSVRWVQAMGRPCYDTDGTPTRIIGLNIDVTERRVAEAELRTSEERLALALEASAGGLWDWDVAANTLWLNDGWCRMAGHEPGTITPYVGLLRELVHPHDYGLVRAQLRGHLEGWTPVYEAEYRIRHANGSWLWILDRGRVVARDSIGRPVRVIGVQLDITPRKEAERRAEHEARHDALTSLPNRTLFREQLAQRVAVANAGQGAFALLLLDLDRFKAVNDKLGHGAGDALLAQVAKRLRAVLAPGDLLARLGGDEFALIHRSPQPEASATSLADHLAAEVARPFQIDGVGIEVGLSVGIALAPQAGREVDALLRSADLALYRAKDSGRSTHCVYEPGMDAAQQERQGLELDLRQALAQDGFDLHYQPQMNVATGLVVGFEALLRWPHPTRGMISPAAFIPLAEDTKLIVPLGEWVLREACREAASWSAPMCVAVNVSALQFQQPGLVPAVMRALAASGLSPERLELEITETVLLHEGEALQALHQLRSLGVRIALDDFGTGYSSLGYLRRFPFDKIKIDQSFIREIDNPDTAAVVRAMVGLGSRLGIAVTAEGVETTRQLDEVRSLGCTEVQGYLIGRPDRACAIPLLAHGRRTAA